MEVALKKSGLRPDEVVMIGDAPYDIESAEKIGVGTIALRCGGFSDDDLKGAWAIYDDDLKGAWAIYDDPADLLAHYDASPVREASRPAGPEVRGEQTTDMEEGGV